MCNSPAAAMAHHDWSKKRRDPCGTATLNSKECEQNGDRQRQYDMLGSRQRKLQPLNRGENRDRWRYHGVAEKHRGPDDPQTEYGAGALAEGSRRERRQRKRSALTVVVGTQQDQHVFERHNDNQRPQNEREDAKDCRARERAVLCGCYDGWAPTMMERKRCPPMAIRQVSPPCLWPILEQVQHRR
jgi:hypothetical protein